MEQLFEIKLHNGKTLYKEVKNPTSLDDFSFGDLSSEFTAEEINTLDVRLWVFAEAVDGTPIYEVQAYQDALKLLSLGE